ncbi:MAG TPA: geranylgeranylglyceryl/heptaprenylglyceryl phosphate synthase [Bacteroidia bacterium]|nr:geranylgeranylglyceryl/heptaprenylglyceryl phosphate synthase [Bacteroidia bacterium]
MRVILPQIQALKAEGKKGFAILIDPDKLAPEGLPDLAAKINASGIDFVLVGGSLLMNERIRDLVPALKQALRPPVILFPGNLMQISPGADAILFLSLISGRNPDLLIGNHVVAAPLLKQSGMEVLPTGYMLIDSGRPTSAHYMSNTMPIPHDKPEIAACTAMAGELLGLQLLYMDGGSGAERSISTEMISAVAGAVGIPLIVGGGIRNKKQAEAILKAGADIIVVGNAFEADSESPLMQDIPALIASF